MKGAARGVVKLEEWVRYYDVNNIVNLRALNGGELTKVLSDTILLWGSTCL